MYLSKKNLTEMFVCLLESIPIHLYKLYVLFQHYLTTVYKYPSKTSYPLPLLPSNTIYPSTKYSSNTNYTHAHNYPSNAIYLYTGS